MQLNSGRHFSYCLNVHPGEGLEDILRVLETEIPEIKQSLCPDGPFGLGLRISNRAAVELSDAVNLRRLKEAIAAAGGYAFTVNGFPYGDFHGTRVKENVYLPDWSDPARVKYTCALADVLAECLPEGCPGSISTVPLGYGYDATGSGKLPLRPEVYQDNLMRTVRHLADLDKRTGTVVTLGLEPEPDCLLETTEDTLAFFEQLYAAAGKEEAAARRHLGVCLDTCHVAMQFEDPAESLSRYARAGIPVTKIQISAALECDANAEAGEKLSAFDDGVYLHQVVSTQGNRWRDLPAWSASPVSEADVLRVHCHVPMHWGGGDGLRSTRYTLTPEFVRALEETDCPHLEVETYTFSVLPRSVRSGESLAENIVSECRWALDWLQLTA